MLNIYTSFSLPVKCDFTFHLTFSCNSLLQHLFPLSVDDASNNPEDWSGVRLSAFSLDGVISRISTVYKKNKIWPILWQSYCFWINDFNTSFVSRDIVKNPSTVMFGSYLFVFYSGSCFPQKCSTPTVLCQAWIVLVHKIIETSVI